MEFADRVVAHLRESGSDTAFGKIQLVIEEAGGDDSTPAVTALLSDLQRRGFAIRVRSGVYRIGPKYAAPSEALPSTTEDDGSPALKKRERLLLEFERAGAPLATREAARALLGDGTCASYAHVVTLIRDAAAAGELRKIGRGLHEIAAIRPRLPVPAPKAVRAPAPPPQPEAPACAEAEGEDAPPSEDERKLCELIAKKNDRLAALAAERAEYDRVRAHLDGLIASNQASSDAIAQEIMELERLRRLAGLIRTALALG